MSTVKKRVGVSRAVAIALGVFACGAAYAQSGAYPTKPIRFIVANSPGGGLDTVARLVSPVVTAALGQQLIIDNRAGAAGSVAAELLAKSAADGYTIMVGAVGNLAVNPHIYKGLGYHPIRDLAPVTFAVSGSNVLVAHPSVPAASVKDLIALLRAKPGSISYGSSGSGNAGHLAGELFQSMSKTKMVHVPYKGGGPAMVDLVAGNINLIFATAASAMPHIKSGRIKPLAVTTAKRSGLVPDLPTIAEAGLKDFEANNWYGILAPAKTPRPIVDRLNKEIVGVLNSPDIKAFLFKQGLDVAPSTPEAFAAYIRSEKAKWEKVIKAANLYHTN